MISQSYRYLLQPPVFPNIRRCRGFSKFRTAFVVRFLIRPKLFTTAFPYRGRKRRRRIFPVNTIPIGRSETNCTTDLRRSELYRRNVKSTRIRRHFAGKVRFSVSSLSLRLGAAFIVAARFSANYRSAPKRYGPSSSRVPGPKIRSPCTGRYDHSPR